MDKNQEEQILGQVCSYYSKKYELDKAISEMIDQFAFNTFVKENRPRTPLGIDVCPKCDITGIYHETMTPIGSETPITTYSCELCGYKSLEHPKT